MSLLFCVTITSHNYAWGYLVLFSSLAEYDEEIVFVRTQLRNAVKATEFKLNTSQSNQSVTMDLRGIRDYLTMLTTERKAFNERAEGSSVTSIITRRFA